MGGDLKLFLDSLLEPEKSSPFLKNILFQNSLKLKKNATYVTLKNKKYKILKFYLLYFLIILQICFL